MIKNQKISLIILFFILFGVFIFYYSFRSDSPPLSPIDESKVTQKQIDTATTELQARIATNPPISQSQIDEALKDLKKRMVK